MRFTLWILLFLFISQETLAWTNESKRFRGVDFRVVTLDLSKENLKVFWRKTEGANYSSITALRADLRARGENFVMAANSGMYSESYAPVGLHVERGRVLKKVSHASGGGGNFSMTPNGVFFITSQGARVVETKEFERSVNLAVVKEATQSGPLLLNNGAIHPKFTEGSPNAKLRNGVGVDSKGRVVFVISDGLVNFYDFALLFKTVLDCPSALYLDGTISKMVTGDQDATDQLAPFAGIWAATTK